ncbi:LysR family transcriptional regulator [Streptomyces alanosinicus]|uniref:LysR family transcriptional regulator n=2 Tax=Streptomyces alanosinicus TaxID=68171 RepID=A0A919D7Z5_9ACTN|nr:LysR family transcriptional regulator [Streptomyces alanosinicus]
MELRDIEIFLALAEELHFGRTAERLHITAARVSQSIRKAERRVGGLLFERTSRTVRLTVLGEQLRQDLSAGYRQITDGIAKARAAAGAVSGTLTLGTMGPMARTIKPVLDLFASTHPNVNLRHREVQPPAPLDLLRSGDADVALLYLPIHEPDLTVGPVVHVSDVLLMLSTGHPYAERESICLEDLGDHCAFLPGRLPASMEAAFQPFHTPSGRPIARAPRRPSTWHEALDLVTTGHGVLGVARDAAHFYPWPGLTFIPVQDMPPVRWGLVWRTADESPLIRALSYAATKSHQRAGT